MERARKAIPAAKDPMTEAIIAAGEQAMADAQAARLSPGPERELIINTRNTHKPKRRRNQPGAAGWMHSPATWWPFKAAYEALVAIATEQQLVDGQVQRIRAAGYKGQKEVYLWVTDENDADGIEVKWTKRGVPFMNLHGVLKDLDLLIPIGTAERFDLLPADENSPHKPALMIYMNKSLETKSIAKKKKRKNPGSAGAGEQK